MLHVLAAFRHLGRLLISLIIGLIGMGMLGLSLLLSLLNSPAYNINVLVLMGIGLMILAVIGGFREFKELME